MNVEERIIYRDMELSGQDTEKYLKIHRPKTLFKYRSGVKKNKEGEFFDIDALQQQYIWQPYVGDLNDPYDCVARIDMSEDNVLSLIELSGFEEKKKIIMESMDREKIINMLKEEFLIVLSKLRAKIHITSFSERPDSIIMWSHYANSHRGFCVEYLTEEFKSFLFPVIYSNDFIDFCKRPAELRLSALTKALEWQYEREWRIINETIDEIVKEGFPYPSPKPVAIYLGSRIDENAELKEKLLIYAQKEKVKIYQMRMQTNSYNLTASEMNIMDI